MRRLQKPQTVQERRNQMGSKLLASAVARWRVLELARQQMEKLLPQRQQPAQQERSRREMQEAQKPVRTEKVQARTVPQRMGRPEASPQRELRRTEMELPQIQNLHDHQRPGREIRFCDAPGVSRFWKRSSHRLRQKVSFGEVLPRKGCWPQQGQERPVRERRKTDLLMVCPEYSRKCLDYCS